MQARRQGGGLGVQTPPEIQENDVKFVFIYIVKLIYRLYYYKNVQRKTPPKTFLCVCTWYNVCLMVMKN
jgi:hypothetical protein